ncbi:MAG: Gfo/Idh/MocA family oxidoreductase [Candidatus Methanoperedens sp.]|nr:Gfo/Idh/MocA family oxidoreductase [Candidatus Methanoperedens sp.]MCZ7371751.1 Gfo/Idh/MocA family oxidoreductase [Candidatus Methanoperedens sp.]
MKIGVIGTGSMGKNHARVYSELKSVEEVYGFDLNKENQDELTELGVISCDSMEELLDSIDAASICVPTKYHYDVVREAIAKDIHCLIEKPIALSVKEGEELVELLKDKDMVVGVGHIERFNPIVNEIETMLKNPFYVQVRRHNPGSSRITDSSVVEDLMIHDIDIIFNVLFNGERYKLDSAGNFDVCNVVVTFNGSVVSMSASRRGAKKIRTLYIEDEDLTIEGDFMNQEVYAYRKPEKYLQESERYTQENIIEKVLVNKVEPLKVELRTFVDCVKRNKVFPITPEQALNNLRICEEIKKGFE